MYRFHTGILKRTESYNSVWGEANSGYVSPGTSFALNSARIGDGRDVGSANAFFAETENPGSTFFFDGNVVRDRETGSVWDYTGISSEGPLKGNRLDPAPGIQHFWFSNYAFPPDLTLY